MDKNLNDNLISQKVNKNKRTVKVLDIALICILGLMLITFLVSAVTFHFGDFTVDIYNKKDSKLMSLYDNRALSNPTSRLSAEGVDNLDAMSENDFQYINNIDDIDGSHNGEKYFAYTFYLKNVSNEAINYELSVNILNTVKGVDEAVRIKLYSDSTHWGDKENQRTSITSAKLAKTGEPEPNTQPFVSDSVVTVLQKNNFTKEQVHKFTLIIFLEGDDPECVNQLQGGLITFNIKIKVI